MASLQLQWNKGLIDTLSVSAPKALKSALSKAGSDAIRTMRTEATRYVRSKKRMKLGRVREALSVTSPRGARELGDLVWTLRVKPIAAPVIAYPARQTRKGVKVSINQGSNKLIKSAFIATMRSGHRGVFKRASKSRLPIKELFTTRVIDTFDDGGMIEGLQFKTQAKFTETFNRVLPLELQKSLSR
jgi:Prophage minor tail protein Z (GPZ)